ncbi:MAG: DUF2089 domain-containing protein [Spirochaetales bacterium]|jgi:hypothetical protein|nr:DUF2089 domain-containing protein [Spirochaetales bacterium]
MKKMVSKCPACDNHSFDIVKLRCKACGTKIEGTFSISKLGSLPVEHQDFIEIFIKCRGNIKDVEKELGISYPTVRGRLDRVIHALGFDQQDIEDRRRSILESLEKKELGPEEAINALKDLT